MRIKNIAVLISGGGSNLQSVMDALRDKDIPARIRIVISDRPGAYGLERTKNAGVESMCLHYKDYDTTAFNRRLMEELQSRDIDLVVLAGFLSILDHAFIHAYAGRIINIHPSLIPSFCGKGFYGKRVHRAALDYGVKISGATVHFVDEGTDTGPVILQQCVCVHDDDTVDTLAARVLEVEHKLLPRAVELLVANRVHVDGRKVTIDDCNKNDDGKGE